MTHKLFLVVDVKDPEGSIPLDLRDFVKNPVGYRREFSRCTVTSVVPPANRMSLTDREMVMLKIIKDCGEATRREIFDALWAWQDEYHIRRSSVQVVANLLSGMKRRGVIQNDRNTASWCITPDGEEYLNVCGD